MTIVFTAILGDCDSLKPAPVGADRAVCFVTDPGQYPDSLGWELVAHPADNPRREAWRLRAVPHTLFDDYSRVVWIDASLTLVNLPLLLRDVGTAPIAALRHHDRLSPQHEGAKLVKFGQSDAAQIQRQIDEYDRAKFTVPYCSVSCILVRDRSEAVERFNQTWDEQIKKHTGDNTQVSLDYSAWKNGLAIKALAGSRHDNPYAVHDHADHKRRRKPYEAAA